MFSFGEAIQGSKCHFMINGKLNIKDLFIYIYIYIYIDNETRKPKFVKLNREFIHI